MGKTESIELTNMCMICDGQGNVLIQNRLNPNWPGICFPGGHVEQNESFTAAVIREVQEETGLTVSDLRMCGIKDVIREDGSRYVVLLYKTDHYSGTLRSSSEGEVMWVPLSDLPGMPLAKTMDTLLRVFCEDNITEQFFLWEDGAYRSSLL